MGREDVEQMVRGSVDSRATVRKRKKEGRIRNFEINWKKIQDEEGNLTPPSLLVSLILNARSSVL